ncbi:FUSC family protein [Paucihalobacter ruber]|uniref:FUSC family protein n=1 Tax=Paucihalobacter ruber TaxID=2567861 RepID=A0A506PGV7_9FLAO|nr:FUSC family protein [Paucihalobacter ruber]TPV32332.1 FUSC family protein [Paucihalobacter ruber]
MRHFIKIIAFIAAILALVLAVTPLSNIALFPLLLAITLSILLYILSKKQDKSNKPVQYILLLSAVALGFMIYKSLFTEAIVKEEAQEEMNIKEQESQEESLKELEALDIDFE